jgi:histidine ammonia-lyase
MAYKTLRARNGESEMAVIINGRDLTIEEVIRVCRNYEKVEIADEAKEAINKARAYVEKKVAEKAVVYGLTTGFGKFANVSISTEETAQLQKNLIMSHTCSLGNNYETKYVRAAMLLRANSLSHGNSGIRLSTVQTLVDMLNAGIHPLVPEKGSVGASGDLAPLSCIALGLIGMGKVEYKGEIVDAKVAFDAEGLTPVELASKEGLALNNGTQMLTAVGLNALWDAVNLMKIADIAGAMTGEALHAVRKAYDPKTHLLRPHQGQIDCAANMRALLEGSGNATWTNPNKVQDPYSQRCIPQVHGACRDAINYVWNAVSVEINSVTDNPIVFPDEDEAISGGNFHGEPMAMAFDFLKMALAELADISERRQDRMLNGAMSEGLPTFLVKNGGLNNGYMIAQYCSASMVSENKIYAHPSVVDSIPTSANQEDIVSMGATSARTAAMVLDNAQKVIGIELSTAAQAIWLRQELGDPVIDNLAPGTRAAYDFIRKTIPPVEEDIIMHDQLVQFDEMVKNNSILEAVEKVVELR